jgi:hypothetical protein
MNFVKWMNVPRRTKLAKEMSGHQCSSKMAKNPTFQCSKPTLSKGILNSNFKDSKSALNSTSSSKMVSKLLFSTLIHNILFNRKIILGRREYNNAQMTSSGIESKPSNCNIPFFTQKRALVKKREKTTTR